jgi:NAD(P)H-hydrate epimerase
MLPVVTPEEMAVIDSRATVPVATLIDRAGRAVARAAIDMLGGTYGRRVLIVAGKGNNGADGLAAARHLGRRGVAVEVIAAGEDPSGRPVDLCIDAAYGTGLRGTWTPPEFDGVPVLAVDIVSGVDGLTGRAAGPTLAADRTVTLVALKPGLLFGAGRERSGVIEIADIGLDVGTCNTAFVEARDVADWIPRQPSDSHKWRAAVWIVAGSPGMLGAAHLASSAAPRAGAGMVRLGVPGVDAASLGSSEVVGHELPFAGWADDVLNDLDRFHALVIGPGLGRDDATALAVRSLVARALVPTVIDGDALVALAWSADGAVGTLSQRDAPTVLTPHDGEFAMLRGARVGADRVASARQLAHDLGVVVLLKGPTTVVAEPGGRALLVAAGDARLATAGTGDVLAGVIGALLARQVPAFEAAAAGAWVHGQAGRRGPRHLIARDLPPLVGEVLAEIDR